MNKLNPAFQRKIAHFLKLSWYRRLPVIAGFFTVILMVSEFNQGLFLLLNSLLYIPFESLWLYISVFGEAEIIAIVVFTLIVRRPDIIWAGLISGIITIISVELAKHYFGLPRPPVVLDYDRFHQIGQYYAVDSFPSVQAAVAFSIAAVVILSVQQQWIKITAFLYACLIGLAQIAIGANWPIDVFAAAVAGWLPATFGYSLARDKRLQSNSAKKILLLIFSLIIGYFTYNLISDDIDIAVIKIVILSACLIKVYPDIIKILKSKKTVKQNKKTRKKK